MVRAVLGVTPAPGGKHVLMGTHNRLLAIASAAFPMAYLEIIAIDPDAPPPSRVRWFGLDEPATQARLRERPRLLHLVARCSRLDATLAALAAQGIDAGQAVAAERASPNGMLPLAHRRPRRWPAAVRRRAADADRMVGHASHRPPAAQRRGAAVADARRPARRGRAARWRCRAWRQAPGAALRALLDTPRGPVELSSDD